MYPFLLVALFFQTSSSPVALLRNCAEPEHALRTLQAASVVHVRSAMAGGSETCYAVTAIVDGKPVDNVKGVKSSISQNTVTDFDMRKTAAAQQSQQAAMQQAMADSKNSK